MHRIDLFRLALIGAAVVACADSGDKPTTAAAAAAVAADRAEVSPGIHRQYGTPVKVGQGSARAYVVYDEKHGGAPLELGVALDERAMEGLPAPMAMPASSASANPHEHVDNHPYLLSLPPRGVTPYQFVELDWNPGGHEPPGIYDLPHFDFHFWTASREVRLSVDPTSEPQYQAKADALPADALRPSFYVVAAPPGAPAPAVPLMGVHWVDTRSPELQGMFGHPQAQQPFTKSFLYGSWDGRFVFLEPMITRAYIMAKRSASDAAMRDEIVPISAPSQVAASGWYPSAYRITWDADAKEYRIALTNLAQR